VNPEKERSFSDFRRTFALRGRPDRQTRIYIQPLGNVLSAHPDFFTQLIAFLKIYFQRKAVLLPSRTVPEAAFDPQRSQFDAAIILDDLASRLPPDSCSLLAFLERDLFHGEYNFLYGLGSLKRGVGVCSLARYNFRYIAMEKDVTFEKRGLKVAAHEICHAMGLRHCTTWRCVLNGSNAIVEADQTPLHLCPHCSRKLAWALDFDPGERRRQLLAFYQGQKGFDRETSFLKTLLGEKK
jgi:archaemetzincin